MTHTVLQFDYDTVDGMTFTGARGRGLLILNDKTAAYDEILLELNDGSFIKVSVECDTDQLIVDHLNGRDKSKSAVRDSAEIAHLNQFGGRQLGWCWVGINWRGYKDTFILSFNDLEPQVMFLGEASKVVVRYISP